MKSKLSPNKFTLSKVIVKCMHMLSKHDIKLLHWGHALHVHCKLDPKKGHINTPLPFQKSSQKDPYGLHAPFNKSPLSRFPLNRPINFK